jgi:integrase
MSVYRRKWKDKETGEIRLGSFYYKFDVDGETYKATVKTARTKRQAEEAERRARQDVHEGVYGARGRKMLFSQFVKCVYLPLAQQHLKASSYYTIERHARMLSDYFQGRTLGQVSRFACENFLRERLKTPTRHHTARSPRTVNSERTTLSGILTLAVEHKYLRENPLDGVKWLEAADAPIKRLSPDEEHALLESSEQSPPFLKPMIQLALWTGFRQGELIALEKSAVDLAQGRVFVFNPKWKRDERKTKGVPLGKEARGLLEHLCAQASSNYLFADEHGGKLSRMVVGNEFRKACAHAGIMSFRFHDLRHEYGSRLGDADVNLKKIALLMGHSNTKQTERYVHPTDESLVAATEVAARGGRTTIVPARLAEVGRVRR